MICYYCNKEILRCYVTVRENGVEIHFHSDGCEYAHYRDKNRKSPNPQGGDMWPHDKKEVQKDN